VQCAPCPLYAPAPRLQIFARRAGSDAGADCLKNNSGTGEEIMEKLQRLLAIEEIRLLKARYFRFMDTKQWDALPSLFMPDMQVLTPKGDVHVQGGEAFAASLKHSLEYSVSVHQGFMGEIEILDADHAAGIWAMQDVIEWEDKHPVQGWKSITGRGHYHETYRKYEGAWRIASLILTRLRLDII
jgi:hypothetical protein